MTGECHRDDLEAGFTTPGATTTEPPPNPPFVFPMQSTSTAGINQNGSTSFHNEASDGRQMMGKSRPQRLSFNTLPDFKFHPSTSKGVTADSDPPSPPTKNKRISPHGVGHRRNGSEFIGGDGTASGLGLMSTSPTKGEGVLPPPPGTRSAPPTIRRGHAHRRSGAISSHDLTAVLRPSMETKGGSAPTTPSSQSVDSVFPTEHCEAVTHSDVNASSQTSSPSPNRRERSSTGPQSRPRVGFSDRIEFISRPLSTISSETSSSLSTIRAGHSVTGSMSSVMSGGPSSSPSAKAARTLAASPSKREMLESRPATAGAVPSNPPQSPSPAEIVGRRPLSASNISDSARETDDTSFPSAWLERFNELHPCADQSPGVIEAPNVEFSRSLQTSESMDVLRNRRCPVASNGLPLVRPRSSPEAKVSKRPRKVKSWAGSLLARKAKNQDTRVSLTDKNSSTPLCQFAPISDFSLEDITFDEDTSCVIEDPSSQPSERSNSRKDSALQRSCETSFAADADIPSPMLDLDAALGPFNTPSLGPSFEDVNGAHFLAARRRMHSSGATGFFSGPGMHYHRRAESAPEMAPINHQSFGLPRFGSNPAMDDVFEEDEEESIREKNLTKESSDPNILTFDEERAEGLGVEVVDTGSKCDSPIKRVSKQRNSVPATSDNSQLEKDPQIEEFRHAFMSNVAAQENGAVEIVGADEEPRVSMVPKPSNNSVMTPTLTTDPYLSRPVSTPMDFAFKPPSSAFATPETYSSAISSPDVNKLSFDVPRMHTATSSITDRATLSSSRAGEQSFDYRASVDDVPSLISSASTTLSTQPPRTSSSIPIVSSTDRSSSLSAAAPHRSGLGTASKRSSLASLSKLVGGSHGERSKLNIEERVQTDDTQKAERKKGRRISRLMRFWKSKEKGVL
ncbi:MAG: hypothetical protein Q9190_000574 [Brigantiaea leucoxantha]